MEFQTYILPQNVCRLGIHSFFCASRCSLMAGSASLPWVCVWGSSAATFGVACFTCPMSPSHMAHFACHMGCWVLPPEKQFPGQSYIDASENILHSTTLPEKWPYQLFRFKTRFRQFGVEWDKLFFSPQKKVFWQRKFFEKTFRPILFCEFLCNM